MIDVLTRVGGLDEVNFDAINLEEKLNQEILDEQKAKDEGRPIENGTTLTKTDSKTLQKLNEHNPNKIEPENKTVPEEKKAEEENKSLIERMDAEKKKETEELTEQQWAEKLKNDQAEIEKNIAAAQKYNEEHKYDYEKDLFPIVDELLALNGLLDQHPTTGRYLTAAIDNGQSLAFDSSLGIGTPSYRNKQIEIIQGYRNKLFGAPFQFLDSVDARFSSTNEFVGYEFLRNFLLHSSILHIYPGVTKYTGGDDSRFQSIVNITRAFSQDMARKNASATTNAEISEKYTGLASTMGEIVQTFKQLEATKGVAEKEILKLFLRSKLQRRLFGISFQYEVYLRYVKLMAHGVALLLKIVGNNSYMDDEYPNGTFVNNNADGETRTDNDPKNPRTFKFQTFDKINWGNYRMVEDPTTVVNEISGTLKKAMGQVGNMMNSVKNITSSGWNLFMDAVTMVGALSPIGWIHSYAQANNEPPNSNKGAGEKALDNYWGTLSGIVDMGAQDLSKLGNSLAVLFQQYNELVYDIAARVQSIEFMVEPVGSTETYNNSVGPSRLKSLTDGVNSYGAEISFITNSGAATGLTSALMNTAKGFTSELANGLGSIAAPFTGNFLSNLFSGAIGAITGNRFIYPDIYQSSESKCDYQFTVNLSSPYGDIYNYYMNIVVPLCHLQALVLPRLKTSNSINSPFMVRAFIPGLMTCEMGIIDNMSIQKNPSTNRVSVNNFPLDVKVTFGIHELYHALAMSPTDDGLSYINNETLKDYLCNMAGIYPTYNRDIELNLSTADMLAEQFNLWKQAENITSTVILSFLGLI